MQQVLVEAIVQLGPAIDARELDLGEPLPRLDAAGLEAMAASSSVRRWLVWLVCLVLAAMEVVWRVTVAVTAICVEVTGRCPEGASARAMEILSMPSRSMHGLTCVQVAASKKSVAIVLMSGWESWLVLVRRVVDGGQEWRTNARRVDDALPILCWRDDERLSLAHGRRLVTFGLGGEIVEEVDNLLDAGRCVGGGYFATQLWACSSLGLLRARNVADARVGWPVRCCSANTRRHEVAMCGLHGSLGLWRFEKQRWIQVASRDGAAPTVSPSIFAKDWVRCVTVLDSTPPLRPSVNYRGEKSGIMRLALGLVMDAIHRLALLDALASTLVSIRWAAAPRKLLSSSEIISAEGGLEIDGELRLPGLIDATPWEADDHRKGLAALTPEGLFFVAPNVCEVVLEERISGSALCSPSETTARGWFAVVANDGRLAVLVKASEARVVERAAKTSLAAAIAMGRRHGATSERMAREARWRLARDVAALIGCDERDTDALKFVVEASSTCVLPSGDNIREAHLAGERAAQTLGIRSLALERAARRLALYEACIAAEHEPFVETDEGQYLQKQANAALSLAIDAAARTACSAMSWDFFVRSSDDELNVALAARGRVAALEIALGSGVTAPLNVLEIVPETVSPLRYERLLPRKDLEWLVNRARQMDAVAGQIAHAEQLLSIVSEEERQTSWLHKDAWHLARLTLAREAGKAFSRTPLSAWETMSTAAKLNATLEAPESDEQGVALAAPMVEVGARFAYTDADMALEQAAAEAKDPALVVRVVRCARVRNITLAARLALKVADDWATTDSGIAVAESVLREMKPVSPSSDQQLALADLEARCSICELLSNEYNLSSMLRLSMLKPTSPRLEPAELVKLLPPSEDDASLAARIGVTSDAERFVLELSRRHTRQCVRDVDKLVAYGLWDAAESETVRRLARVATVSRLFDGDDSILSLEFVLRELKDDEATEAVEFAISRCARPSLLLSSSEERPGIVADLDDRLAVAEKRGLQVAHVERRALWGLALLGAPDALLAFSVDDDRQARMAGEARCALVALEVAVAANDLLADELDARPAMDDTSLHDSHRMRRWALERLKNDEFIRNEAHSVEDVSIAINAAVLASRAMTRAERVAAAAAAHAARVFCSKGVATPEEKASVALHLSRQARGLEEAVVVDVVVALAHEAAAAVCDDARLDAEARRFVAANALRLPHNSHRTVVLLDQWTALASGDESDISEVEASPTTVEAADELLAKLATSSLPISSLDELASHARSFATLDERLAQQEADRPKRRARKRPQEANDELVAEIAALGFSRNASIRAARAVDNSGLEEALKWSLEHSTDPNFDAPVEAELEDEVEDSPEGDVRRRLAARVSRAYFALAVELAPNREIQEAARNCEAEARRRCHIVADGAALRQALDEEEYEASAASGQERSDGELLVRAARSTTSGTALEKALQVAHERGMSATDLAVEHLDSLWNEARRTGELEELSNRLLAAKGSGRGLQAAADAGVSLGPPSGAKSPLRAATAKAVSTLRDTDPARLTDWIKQCYAAETTIEPLKLVCNLAKTYSTEQDFSKRAQLQYLNLNALSRALSRSTSGADVGRLNVKRLLGDLLVTPQHGDDAKDASAAVEELAKFVNADNAIALQRLTPKLKGISAADVYECAVRNEIARCLAIPLEDEDVHAIELKANLDDRLGRVLSRLVAVGGSAVRAVRAGFAARLGSAPLEAHHTVASAVARLAADKKVHFDDDGLEAAVVAAARLVSRGFGDTVNALAAATLRGAVQGEKIVAVAAEVAATRSSAEVREVVGYVVAGSTDEVVSAAFDGAALAALKLAPPRAVEGIKQLLERAADDEAARSAVLAATRRVLDSTPADDTEACQAFAELAALADPSKERHFAVRMILTEVRDLGVDVPPPNDDKVAFFRAFLGMPQLISANILWRLLDALSPGNDRQQMRDDELVAAALGDEPEIDDQDDELASCWFELLSAASSEDISWLARAGCPPGVTYSRASELQSLDTLRPTDAIQLGLLGRFRAVRKEAASRLAAFESPPPLMPDVLDIALRSGEDLPDRLLYSAARAACDIDAAPASLFESPCFVVALYLIAAHRRQSQAHVLVALDLAAQALGVHPGLRTFDAVLLAARSAFATDGDHPHRPGWVHWPRLRRLATAALDANFPA